MKSVAVSHLKDPDLQKVPQALMRAAEEIKGVGFEFIFEIMNNIQCNLQLKGPGSGNKRYRS